MELSSPPRPGRGRWIVLIPVTCLALYLDFLIAGVAPPPPIDALKYGWLKLERPPLTKAKETPVQTETKKTEEAPVQSDIKKPEEPPVQADVKKPEEPPVQADIKNAEEAPVPTDTKKAEEPPVQTDTKMEQASVQADTKKTEESPVQIDVKKAEDAPAPTDIKKTQDTPAQTDIKKAEGAPVQTAIKKKEEAPVQTEIKKTAETSGALVQPRTTQRAPVTLRKASSAPIGWTDNQAVAGEPYETLPKLLRTQCERHCRSDHRCNVAEFVKETETCRLFGSIENSIPNPTSDYALKPQ